MTLKQLRIWLNEMPEEFDEFSVISRVYQPIEGTDLELLTDKPFVAIFADEERGEFCFIDDTSFEEFKKHENIDDSTIQD